ncbi:MAG: 23S rRNA (pseudouridine(1915)-N(3))-methyltransferase RlmH [Bdellovibrionota bacterium]
MKIKILTFGKLKESFYKEAEAEYLKRFGRDFSVEALELSQARFDDPLKNKATEAKEYFKKIPRGAFKIVLDEKGKQFTSEGLAKNIQTLQTSGNSTLIFAIGGAFGWDKSVIDDADLVLSLSKFTFPHQLARVVLVEQLYRAHMIIKGSSYHK